MRLFWKLLAGMLAILMLSFSVFGTILLQSSFRRSLQMEKENGLEEMRLFQYAFLSSADGLTEEAMVQMTENYYLGAERNIEYIYENRDRMYRNYKMALLVITAFGTVLAVFLQWHLQDRSIGWRRQRGSFRAVIMKGV
jgi:hypothetical protein